RISAKALTVSIVGVDTRIKSAPASTQRSIWATVASTSQVSVLVMLCTLIGASPPIATSPTYIFLVRRRLIGPDVDIDKPFHWDKLERIKTETWKPTLLLTLTAC